jgi:hypothetical protein
MPDPLYLSLWFPSFEAEDMLPRALTVMQQFPFSAQRPGITYLALHPVSWEEPTILERRFRPGLAEDGKQWALQPVQAKFLVHGLEFNEGMHHEAGHIQVDFGLDTPFLHEGVALTADAETKVRTNVQKLVAFTTQVEKNSGASARLLWSESEENFAQKLIARLQRVQ